MPGKRPAFAILTAPSRPRHRPQQITRRRCRDRPDDDANTTPATARQALDALEALKQRLHEDVAKLRQADGDRTPYGGDFESLVTAAPVGQSAGDRRAAPPAPGAPSLGHREGQPARRAGAVRRLRILWRRDPGRAPDRRAGRHPVRALPEQARAARGRLQHRRSGRFNVVVYVGPRSTTDPAPSCPRRAGGCVRVSCRVVGMTPHRRATIAAQTDSSGAAPKRSHQPGDEGLLFGVHAAPAADAPSRPAGHRAPSPP